MFQTTNQKILDLEISYMWVAPCHPVVTILEYFSIETHGEMPTWGYLILRNPQLRRVECLKI